MYEYNFFVSENLSSKKSFYFQAIKLKKFFFFFKVTKVYMCVKELLNTIVRRCVLMAVKLYGCLFHEVVKGSFFRGTSGRS